MIGFLSANRRVLSVAMVISMLSGLVTAATLQHDAKPFQSRELTDSTVWVVSTTLGVVSPIDSTTGRGGPLLPVDGATGHRLFTVQAGSDGYVVDETESTIRHIDASTNELSEAWLFEAAEELSFYVDEVVGWVFSGEPKNVLQQVTAGPSLSPVGEQIALRASGDDGAMLPTSAIVLPDEQRGQVVRVSTDSTITRADIGPAGNDLAVRLVDQRPVVLDLDGRLAIRLDENLDEVDRCPIEATGDEVVPVEGEGVDGVIAVLSPAQGALIITDLNSCTNTVELVGSPGDDFGVPVVADGVFYVPNFTTRTVLIVTPDGPGLSYGQSETETLGPEGMEFELLVEHGLVVFNDPASERGGAVSPAADIVGEGKYVVDSETGRPFAVAGSTGGIGAAAPAAIGLGGSNNDSTEDGSADEPEPEEEPEPEPEEVDEPDPEPGDELVLPTLECLAVTESQVGVAVVFDVADNYLNLPQVLDWTWSLDDGRTSKDARPSFGFDTPDTYVATIVVDLAGVADSSDTCTVTVGDRAPVLQPTIEIIPAGPRAGDPVTVRSTTAGGDAIQSWSWELLGAIPSSADTEVVSNVIWPTEGDFSVSLTVTNADGAPFTTSAPVTVGPAAGDVDPVVAIRAIENARAGEQVTLAYDTVEGSATTTEWRITPPSGPVVTRDRNPDGYTLPGDAVVGTYTVDLRVLDDEGRTGVDRTTFDVIGTALTASIGADPTRIVVDQAVDFTGNSSRPGASFVWDFDDGSSSVEQNPSHTFRSAGNFTVVLTVTEGGDSDTDSVAITVDPRAVVVPSCSGAAADVVARLQAAGLTTSQVFEDVTDPAQDGQVLGCTPPAGSSVASGSTVQVRVGRLAVTTVTVPPCSGDPVQVRDSLGAVGLAVNFVNRQTFDPAEDGQVIACLPASGTAVAPDTIIDVQIGQLHTTVPSPCTGQTEAQLVSALQARGLVANVVDVATSNPAEVGIVLSCNPDDGIIVPSGSTVDVGVGRHFVVVPNVMGEQRSDASTTLGAVPLAVDVVFQDVTNPAQDDVVLSQTPIGGASVPANSIVGLTVGRLVAQLPDVRGDTTSIAVSTLLGLGFTNVSQVDVLVFTDAEDGIVLAQSPGPGVVPINSQITLDVGVRAFIMPDLTGGTESQVRSAMSGITNNIVVQNETVTDPAQVGTVIRHTPSAGQPIRVGGQLTIVIGVP